MQPSNRDQRDKAQRFGVFAGAVVAGFGLVAIGLVRLQVADHERYLQLSKENHVRPEILRAPRGTIFDRNGQVLADSAPSFSIVFRPFPAESVGRDPSPDPEWVARVSRLIEQDPAEVRRLVQSANTSGQTAVLKRNVPFPIWSAVEESKDELPGVDVQREPLRHYAYGNLAAHLLGYAGEINEIEVDSLSSQGYRAGDLIGRTGVERSFEDILRGQDGAEYVVVNAAGKRVATFKEGERREPVSGHDLVMTLDLKVQKALEQAMAGVERGAAVAMDPRDGGILGLVSRPVYDPNEFSMGLSWDRWRELSNGGTNPLLNRAIQGVYPPGSTFKVVTMLAALRAGIASPSTRLQPCSGRYNFGGRWFGCWKHAGHGSLNFVEALEHSCDVYFYQIGLRLELPRLEETARALGLGDRTGIDLPQEKKGLIPSPAWYDKRWGAGRWRKGLLLNLAIGQGEILVTPLQLAMLVSEAAMDGQPLRPHVVKQVRGAPEYHWQRPGRARLAASPTTWSALHEAMEGVVSGGTATLARVPGLRIAGKTGTAQNPHGKDHALFACYAPAENPQIALAFVIENSGHGGSIAAPMAAQVLSTLFLPDSLRPAAARPPAVADTAAGARGD